MKIIFAAVLLINIIFGMETSQIQQGKALFRRLRNTGDIGNNLVEAIQLELSAADGEGGAKDQTIVSKVVEMLKEVQTSLEEQQTGFTKEVDSRNESCYAQVTGLKEEIKKLDDSIDSLEDKLPLRKDEYELKQTELDALQEEVEFYTAEILKLDVKSKARKDLFIESKEEHDQMTAALEQAKRLIRQLKTSFLQKNTPEFSLAQVTEHYTNSLKAVNWGHNKRFLSYLLSISQVANQEQVDQLVDIIEDLIESVGATAGVEAGAEAKRVERYNADRTRIKANLEQADADVLDAQAGIRSSKLRYTETQADLEGQQTSRNSKQQQLDDHRKVCDDQVSSLQSRIKSYAEILDIIRQVLILLENSSISGSKLMVSDANPDKKKEKSVLGDYSKDSGENPNESSRKSSNFVEKQRNSGYDPLLN